MTTRSFDFRPLVPYRVGVGTLMGGLGDDPATISQIIEAGMDPTAPGVTYTVDSAGNVMQNLTVQASPLPVAPQQPLWPLLAVLAFAGVVTYQSGKRSRR